MDIYRDIVRSMEPDALETLKRFRIATKQGERLPVDLDTLPYGFLECSFDDDGNVVAVLSTFGKAVAEAAEECPEENAA